MMPSGRDKVSLLEGIFICRCNHSAKMFFNHPQKSCILVKNSV